MANKDFFLSPDDAQTLGDINYMRKSVRVRHTFPKTLKNPNGFAVEKEVSSSEDRVVDGFNTGASETTFSSTFSSPTVQTTPTVDSSSDSSNSESVVATPKKRPQGTSMDMFRNMARNIGKK